MREEWRDIPGYENRYQVSSIGRIRSLPRTDKVVRRGKSVDINYQGKVLKLANSLGYHMVNLTNSSGEKRKIWLHRAVCLAFHGEPPTPRCDAAHKDGTRTNNRPENLRWTSRLENIRDKAAHGTQPRGKQIWNARLTEEKVLLLRRSSLSTRSLAKQLGVSAEAARAARIGRTWAHVGC